MPLTYSLKTALLLFLTTFGCKDSANQSNSSGQMTNASDRYTPKPYVELKHPDWSRNATIYEVNVRQFTPEGTFKAFEAHLR